MSDEYELRILTYRDGERVGTEYCEIDNEQRIAIVRIALHGVKQTCEGCRYEERRKISVYDVPCCECTHENYCDLYEPNEVGE